MKPQEVGVYTIDEDAVGLNGDGGVGGAGQTLKRANFWGLGGDCWGRKSVVHILIDKSRCCFRYDLRTTSLS